MLDSHSAQPAVPHHRRSAVLQASYSCVETSGSRLVEDPDYAAVHQSIPISSKISRVRLFMSRRPGRHCHETTKS